MYDPAIPLLSIHTEENGTERDTCTPMFIAALFIIARTWMQPRCPSADEWIRKLWYTYTMEYYSAIKRIDTGDYKYIKKDLHDQDNHNGVITQLEPDILECEVQQALESITVNKASGGDGIPVELFQILEDGAVKVLRSICQHIWKTH